MTEWIVTSGVLILVVVGLRLLLKGKISLRLQYGLWVLVLLRLLIPFSFDSRISVMNLLPEPEILEQSLSYTDYQLPDLAVPEIDPTLPAEQQQAQLQQNQAAFEQEIQAEKERTGTPVTVEAVLLWVWIAGMAVTFCVLTGTNLHFYARLRRSRVRLSCVDAPLPVYVTGCLQTPCLFGMLSPGIYLPSQLTGEQTLRHILTHELTHWRHKDHIWSVLRCICLVLHWYNPLVWIAASLSKQDAELACDEAVIEQLGEANRTAYGQTLIEMACVKRDAAGLLITATTMLTTKKSLKERISMIVRKPKTTIVTLICVLLIAAVAVGCTFTGASGEQSSEPPVMQACHFEEKNAIYVYEKPGFGSDFFIKLNRDGTFTYSEGSLSSYFGLGTWTLTDNILALTDKPTTSMAFYNEFRVEEDAIVWLSENSTGFLYRGYVPLADGARFLYRGSEESPTPSLTYVEDITDVAKGIFDGGPRATFVNVDGTVFVWNHFVVDTLDGLNVTEIGTVTENDITKLPENHLSACRISVGTAIYMGKDVEDSQYPAVYCKVNSKSYYARFLPEAAFHGEDRWWENATIHDGAQTLTLEKLSQVAKEKGGLLSHTDLQGYSHVALTNSNCMVYRLYDVEKDYQLVLLCANTQTAVEALAARLYHKDSPDDYIDVRIHNIDAFINRGVHLFREDLPIADNQNDVIYVTSVYAAE